MHNTFMRTTLVKHSELSSLSNSEFNQRFGDKLAITLRELKPWIVEAYERIERGELIQGCKTKSQLANIIGRSPRTIERLVYDSDKTSHTPLDSNQVTESDRKPIEMVPAYEAKREPPQVSGPVCSDEPHNNFSVTFTNLYTASIAAEDTFTVMKHFFRCVPMENLQAAVESALETVSDKQMLEDVWAYLKNLKEKN